MKPYVITAVSIAFAAIAAAHAQGAPAIERATGTVQSISNSAITLVESSGKVDVIMLLPSWAVSISKPISIEEIQPGSYVGTTNYAKADGTGRSTEVHVSPPGMKGPGVDFVMDANAGTTMTNGVVATVVKSEGGRVLAVNYGPGVRRVTVPANVPVVLNSPGDRSMVKVGHTVRIATFTPKDGGAPRQYVTVGESGGPPPL